jgi:hypothetical protein
MAQGNSKLSCRSVGQEITRPVWTPNINSKSLCLKYPTIISNSQPPINSKNLHPPNLFKFGISVVIVARYFKTETEVRDKSATLNSDIH